MFVLMLAGHLLSVNVSSAGPLICIWLEWREARGDGLAGQIGRRLAGFAIVLFVVGMVLGFGLIWHNWSPAYKQAILHVGRRIGWGAAELVFSLALMIVHLAWWRAARDVANWHRAIRCVCPLAAATNLLYHFPFLFIILSNLAGQSQLPEQQLDSAGFRQMMLAGDVLARTVHFWLASLAVTGTVLMLFGARRAADEDQRAAVWGGRIALVPTLLQIPVGFWLLTQLPGLDQQRLMGEDLIGTSLLGASMLAALALAHQLLAISMGALEPARLRLSAITMVAIVVLMTGTLRRLDDTEKATTNGTSTKLETMDGIGNDHNWRSSQRVNRHRGTRIWNELLSLSSETGRETGRRLVVSRRFCER